MKCWASWDSKIYLMPAPSSNAAGWNFMMNCRPPKWAAAANWKRDRMKKEMLINVLQPEECRIAILEDGVLEELYVERTSHESYVGNIYKGRIVNIEPSIQAAFVDFGVGRNGFLHVSDVEPAYYRHLEQGRRPENGRRGGRDRDRGRDRNHARRPPRHEAPPARHEEDVAPEEEAELRRPLTEEPPPAPEPAPEEPIHGEAPAEATAPQAAEEAPRERRRSRGGSRRRREEPTEAPAEEAPRAEADEPEPPQPRPMDSAERRTEEDEDAPGGSENEPAAVEDEDLFFPRPPEAIPATPGTESGPLPEEVEEE